MGLERYNLFLDELIMPILLETKKELELDYLDAKFIKEDQDIILKINIDKDYSIDLALIEKFTQIVNEKIDLLDYDVDNYILDISSPSSERLIEKNKLSLFIGKYVFILTNDNKEYEAKIDNIENNQINCFYFIKGQKKKLNIPLDDIKEIKTSYKI